MSDALNMLEREIDDRQQELNEAEIAVNDIVTDLRNLKTYVLEAETTLDTIKSNVETLQSLVYDTGLCHYVAQIERATDVDNTASLRALLVMVNDLLGVGAG